MTKRGGDWKKPFMKRNLSAKQILAEAKQAALVISRRGEDEVAREQAKAMVHLRSQFVEGVIGAAKHAAANSVTDTHHRRLIEEFTKDLAVKS